MKVIFLDIDGVLMRQDAHHRKVSLPRRQKQVIGRLKTYCIDTGAKVVLRRLEA